MDTLLSEEQVGDLRSGIQFAIRRLFADWRLTESGTLECDDSAEMYVFEFPKPEADYLRTKDVVECGRNGHVRFDAARAGQVLSHDLS